MLKKRVVTLPINVQYSNIFREFCQRASIHGFKHVQRSKKLHKFIWIITLLLMLFLLLWSCSNSVLMYLRFDVKTKISYQSLPEMEFPAITFCSENHFTRSLAGSMGLLLYVDLVYRSFHYDTILQSLSAQQKYCHSNSTPTEDVSVLDSSHFLEIFSKVARDSFNSVVKCWWNSAEIECNNVFFNHLLDRGLCFTVGHNPVFLRNNLGLAKLGYGLNISNLPPVRRVYNKGVAPGLSVLMNVNQSEYCGVSGKWRGAGFMAVAHDSLQAKPSFFNLKNYLFLPGFKHMVLLKPTIFRRHTANLGRCKNAVYAVNNTFYYSQSICLAFCYVAKIVQQCNCIAGPVAGMEKRMSEITSVNFLNVSICKTMDDIKCMKKQQEITMFAENPHTNCPYCIQACYETSYDVTLTYEKFSPSIFHLLNSLTGFDRETLEKNFLFVDFFYQLNDVVMVDESQAFTIDELFIYFGSAIGLFFGMSFASLGEIFQLIGFGMTKLIKKLMRKNKVHCQKKVVAVKKRKRPVVHIQKHPRIITVKEKIQNTYQ